MDTRATDLLRWLESEGARVTELVTDSRKVRPGDVFLAYKGARVDGRAFIPDALAAGASAVLWEREGFEWNPAWQAKNRPVENLREISGHLASEVYGRPSERLWTMGVTGTNGKTSCSQWLAQAFTSCGSRTGVIGTLGIGFPATAEGGPALEPSPNTTPDAIVLQRSLAKLLGDGARGVAMEVSSIGLEQARVAGVKFSVALFTNLSRDHLDYHADMEAYARAKQQLFLMSGLEHAVLNLDDVQGVQISRLISDRGVQRVGYSCFEGVAARSGLESFVEARNLGITASGLSFDVVTSWGQAHIDSPLLGRFNVSNLLGVLGTLLVSGIPLERAAAALEELTPVPGRMQRLGGNGKPLVVVDYAHTPDALQQALGALRDVVQSSGGKLAVVFGCGGERDRGKRPLMGAVASRQADRVVITSDNPRSEQPEAIVADIVAGTTGEYEVLVDRRLAIENTLKTASAADVVLIAGKGHEDYQEIGGVKLPYSDLVEARRVLEERRA